MSEILDSVNHPSHYNTDKYECIDVMEDVFGAEAVKAFCLCNAFKYLFRCNAKHNSPVEDVKKAKWYLEWYLRSEESNGTNADNGTEE